MSNPGYCPDCKESGWACRCGRPAMSGETTMTYVDRMRAELSELGAKLEKLEAFIESDAAAALDETERALLKIQARAMETYYHILDTRLSRAPPQ